MRVREKNEKTYQENIKALMLRQISCSDSSKNNFNREHLDEVFQMGYFKMMDPGNLLITKNSLIFFQNNYDNMAFTTLIQHNFVLEFTIYFFVNWPIFDSSILIPHNADFSISFQGFSNMYATQTFSYLVYVWSHLMSPLPIVQCN